MTAKVYFAGRRAGSPKESLPKKVEYLFDRVEAAKAISKNDLVGVKLHFGERGGTAFINPVLVRCVVDKIKEAGGKPFLFDTNTLYTGGRSNAVDHLETALRHGFSYATVGAPLIIGDGLRGRSYYQVKINGKHFDSVRIASAAVEADVMVVLSHVKGHMLAGFGGALKNLGMGCANRSGKQKMHSSLKPLIKEEHCIQCGTCLEWCPSGAIDLSGGHGASINWEVCSGCGECIISCTHGAIQVQWRSAVKDVVEKTVEYAAGALQGKAGVSFFFNFLLDVVPDCDCCPWSDIPVVPDIGILASRDPVAIDQASLDLVNGEKGIEGSKLKGNFEPGADKFQALHPDSDYLTMLSYAEEMGLGTRDYELLEVSAPEEEKARGKREDG